MLSLNNVFAIRLFILLSSSPNDKTFLTFSQVHWLLVGFSFSLSIFRNQNYVVCFVTGCFGAFWYTLTFILLLQLRLMQSELSVEEVLQQRTLKVICSRMVFISQVWCIPFFADIYLLLICRFLMNDAGNLSNRLNDIKRFLFSWYFDSDCLVFFSSAVRFGILQHFQTGFSLGLGSAVGRSRVGQNKTFALIEVGWQKKVSNTTPLFYLLAFLLGPALCTNNFPPCST